MAIRLLCTLRVIPLPAHAADAPPVVPNHNVVTASRTDLQGKTQTASTGSVTRDDIALRPKFRPGELRETVPGLVVTVHSGEGKANRYLLRGFNLDHGTDFASLIDSMPTNRPTNAHGHGEYRDDGIGLGSSWLDNRPVCTVDVRG